MGWGEVEHHSHRGISHRKWGYQKPGMLLHTENEGPRDREAVRSQGQGKDTVWGQCCVASAESLTLPGLQQGIKLLAYL